MTDEAKKTHLDMAQELDEMDRDVPSEEADLLERALKALRAGRPRRPAAPAQGRAVAGKALR